MIQFLENLTPSETGQLEYQYHSRLGVRHLSHKQLEVLKMEDSGSFNPRRIKKIMRAVGEEWSVVWSETDPINSW
jgi:hypothetical protein